MHRANHFSPYTIMVWYLNMRLYFIANYDTTEQVANISRAGPTYVAPGMLITGTNSNRYPFTLFGPSAGLADIFEGTFCVQ